jgi:hypothetical protein
MEAATGCTALDLTDPMTYHLTRDIYRLFVNRVDCYLTWYDRWVLRRAPLNTSVIERALRGELCLGVQAVSGSHTARWTCLDADIDAQLGPLAELAASLPAETRPLERSRRGGHLWLFHTPVMWEVTHQRGVELATMLDLSKIEVYPEHAAVHAVRLPGAKHPKTGLTHPIVEPTTGEIRDLESALAGIRTIKLITPDEPTDIPLVRRQSYISTAEFDELVAALTELRVYSPGTASAKCPWHDDNAPSLYVKGRRFHCLACGVWDDVADVRRYLTKGIRPPS